MSKNKDVIPLVIDREYSDFKQFYISEKRTIYMKIIDAFQQLINENVEKKELLVLAKVEGHVFDTTFIIDKESKKILKDVVSPYFETLEEYETCSRINKVYSEL